MGDTIFINGRAAVHATSAGTSTAFPDVCLCPPTPPAGPIPTPLPNLVVAADLMLGAPTVLIEGNPAGNKGSFFAKSTGNEPSVPTGGGVISHASMGMAYFQSFSPNVMIGGQPAVRHMDLLTQNHLAPAPGNTPPAVWLSTMMAPAAGQSTGPESLSLKLREGTFWVGIILCDETGEPIGDTDFVVDTPGGDSVEGAFLWGGSLNLSQIKKGTCKLRLPTIDRLSQEAGRKAAVKAQPGTVAYAPGRPLSLDTGKIHRITIPAMKTLFVHIAVWDPKLSEKDRFTLKSSGGEYNVTRPLPTKPPKDQPVMLAFPAVIPDLSYTLTHQAGSKSRDLFKGWSFDQLFPKVPPEDNEAETDRLMLSFTTESTGAVGSPGQAAEEASDG